jgi:hypothetical protein
MVLCSVKAWFVGNDGKLKAKHNTSLLSESAPIGDPDYRQGSAMSRSPNCSPSTFQVLAGQPVNN